MRGALRYAIVLAMFAAGCAADPPEGYWKYGASRQEFFTDYTVCENAVREPAPLAVGYGVVGGMIVGNLFTRTHARHCMEALGWQYGATFQGFQP